jgi:glycosyltransferase involved in cell wall biosynthesis
MSGGEKRVGIDAGLAQRLPAYALVTPARNEAAFIGQTLESMVSQSVPPVRWVVVSDGSTDGTDELVSAYRDRYDWIELVRMPERAERHFSGKVAAFNAGYERLRGLSFDIVGNLDADISFEEDYFAFLLQKFAENPLLGVGGTPFREQGRQYDYRFSSIDHVSGACQLFRRECFEAIGGYVPRKMGGVDLVAVLTARLKGWQTRSFTEMCCIHHRTMGTAMRSRLGVAFRGGVGDYLLGSHPLWELCRCLYQMRNPPVIIGGPLRLAGFVWGALRHKEQSIPRELVEFRRKEQLERLRELIISHFGRDSQGEGGRNLRPGR